MDRRTDIVKEARLGQLGAARAATGGGGRLVNDDGAAGARQLDRRGETIRAGPDDNRIGAGASWRRYLGSSVLDWGAATVCSTSAAGGTTCRASDTAVSAGAFFANGLRIARNGVPKA